MWLGAEEVVVQQSRGALSNKYFCVILAGESFNQVVDSDFLLVSVGRGMQVFWANRNSWRWRRKWQGRSSISRMLFYLSKDLKQHM